MAAKTARTKSKAKAEPAPEEDFDEELVETETDDDLEELEEDEVADEAPAKKGKKVARAADNIVFGIQDLCALIKKETGDTKINPRGARTLIRKMARDESGRVDREIVPGNRTRYNWTGPNDPEVRAILAAFKGGELEAEKNAKLGALKEKKALETAAKKAKAAEAVEEDDSEDETPAPKKASKKTAAPAKKRRKAAPVVEVEDDEDLELDEDDE